MPAPIKPLIAVVFGLSLAAAGAATAQAQSTVTRQITREPVETVIIRNPNGTAVTRRILTPEPGFTTMPPPNYVAPPLGGDALAPDYVEPLETVTTRRVVVNPAPQPAPTSTVGVAPRARSERVVTERRNAPRTVTRTVTRTVVLPPPPLDAPLALSVAERQAIYTGITRRELYYPAPAPVEVAPADYPLRAIYPSDSYAYRDYAYRDYAYRPDYYRERYVYHWDGVPLVIGARMPASVALYGVPDWLAARIPSARPYSFARLDDRVYLVDPATSIIVAEIAP
jgi:hypothetical protein